MCICHTGRVPSLQHVLHVSGRVPEEALHIDVKILNDTCSSPLGPTQHESSLSASKAPYRPINCYHKQKPVRVQQNPGEVKVFATTWGSDF